MEQWTTMSERVPSGIPGLDELVDGGLQRDSVTLITGGPGTGKTVLCTQFLAAGLEQDEKCLFITTEELTTDIMKDATNFGWDLEGNDNFRIEYVNPSTRSNYFREDVEAVRKEFDPDRIVIDSISALGSYWEQNKETRSNLTGLIHSFKESGATTLITAEVTDGQSRYGIAEFIADGVVCLDMSTLGEDVERSLQVSKMRGTDLNAGEYSFEFTDSGIELV